jgi:pimeloyl-ACP methyl ester carboxylesterase
LAYDYDTFAADLHGLMTHLDLKDARLVSLSMCGGEVVRSVGTNGAERVAKAVVASAVPPYLYKSADNAEGGLDDATSMASRVHLLGTWPAQWSARGSLPTAGHPAGRTDPEWLSATGPCHPACLPRPLRPCMQACPVAGPYHFAFVSGAYPSAQTKAAAIPSMRPAMAHERVQKLMQLHGIRAKGKRRFKVTTDSKHDLPIAPNLLDRWFTVAEPDWVWAGDII